jgi:hypothetical protein
VPERWLNFSMNLMQLLLLQEENELLAYYYSVLSFTGEPILTQVGGGGALSYDRSRPPSQTSSVRPAYVYVRDIFYKPESSLQLKYS